MRLLNDLESNFIYENYKGRSNKELTDMFNAKFNKNLTTTQITSWKKNRNLKSGLTGHFIKGQEPVNKGKTWDEYLTKEQQEKAKQSWFKKGHKLNDEYPLGTERIDPTGGYVMVKISNKGEYNDRWKARGRVNYEKKYGKIPDGYVLYRLDGNPKNDNLENLAIISSQELLIINSKNLKYGDPELNRIGVAQAKLLAKINDENKRRK